MSHLACMQTTLHFLLLVLKPGETLARLLNLQHIYLSIIFIIIFSDNSFFYYQVEEMEIPRAAAERSLREHKGDVVEALVSLTNWQIYEVK